VPVLAVEAQPGAETVYNIEVHGEERNKGRIRGE
jgi:hypothetical protein